MLLKNAVRELKKWCQDVEVTDRQVLGRLGNDLVGERVITGPRSVADPSRMLGKTWLVQAKSWHQTCSSLQAAIREALPARAWCSVNVGGIHGELAVQHSWSSEGIGPAFIWWPLGAKESWKGCPGGIHERLACNHPLHNEGLAISKAAVLSGNAAVAWDWVQDHLVDFQKAIANFLSFDGVAVALEMLEKDPRDVKSLLALAKFLRRDGEEDVAWWVMQAVKAEWLPVGAGFTGCPTAELESLFCSEEWPSLHHVLDPWKRFLTAARARSNS